MFKVLETTKDDLIAISINGKVIKSDYDKINPMIEKTVKEYGKVRLYIQIDNIEGIEFNAFVEDVKTYFRHFSDIRKIAVVGETAWQKMWSNLASPFVSGKIKFFEKSQVIEANNWIKS
jgi:hypothetical protein